MGTRCFAMLKPGILNRRLVGEVIGRLENKGLKLIGLKMMNISPELASRHYADHNVRFSTYAVPMILGEIKRYMRDDGYLKVSRSLKSLSSKIARFVDEKIKDGGENPTVEEIAQHFELEPTEDIFAMDATKLPVSLYEKANDSDGKQTELIEHLHSDEDKKMLDKIILKDMLAKLQPREQKIVILRYFRDMTQGEIAHKLGVSQVQISRLENRILKKLKELYEEQ